MQKTIRINLILVILIFSILTLFTWAANQKQNSGNPAIPDAKQKSIFESLRSMVTGCEAYNVDYDTYPQKLSQLTTPISYLRQIPDEPYGGNWIISVSDDSIYLTIQSSTHPEYKRSFANKNLFRTYSDEKLIQLILNAEQRDIRHEVALFLLSKNQQPSKWQWLANYFARQTQKPQDITTRINATEVMGTVFYNYSGVTEFNLLENNLTEQAPLLRAATITALSQLRLPDNFEYMKPDHSVISTNIESDIMRFMVQDTSALVRAEATRSFGLVAPTPKNRTIISLSLLTALNDPEITVRANAAEALGRQARYVADSTAVITKLCEIAKRDQPPAQVAAISALGEFKAKSATPLLLSYLSSDKPDIKNATITALCEIGDPNAVSQMKNILGTEFKRIQKPLIIGLANANDPKATAIILGWIRDPDPDIRNMVISTLTLVTTANSERILLTAIKDSTQNNRVLAARVLNQIHPNIATRAYLRDLSVSDKILLVKQESSMIATGLEAYYVDNSSYPLLQHYPRTLTTPIAYMNYLPADPFSKSPIKPLRYFTSPNGQSFWIIASVGPDNKADFDISQIEFSSFQPERLKPFTYDPTNGLRSSGDIFRLPAYWER